MMVATRRMSTAVKHAAIPHAIKSLSKKLAVRAQPPLAPSPKATARAASGPRPAKKQRAAAADTTPLIDLGDLEECEMLRRPSSRNKSPYVADVKVLATGLVAVAHCPNLDSGGKCVAGSRVLCSRQAGVNSDTVGPYGTPKCELVIRLLRCYEPEYHGHKSSQGVWVSAHPALTESMTLALIKRGTLDARLAASPVDKDAVETQRAMKRLSSESASGSYRPDYRLNHKDGSVTILEVKQVVDTDYDPAHVEARARMQAPLPVYSPMSQLASASPSHATSSANKAAAPHAPAPTVYQRAGIFPWGKRTQKGPDGQLVVSARAIDHVRELAKLAAASPVARGGSGVRCAILFVCGRSDATGMRPNGAACPTFARCLLLPVARALFCRVCLD